MTVKGGNMCKNWPNFPISLSQRATGGFIGNTVMICGGSMDAGLNAVDECYSLTSEKRTLITHMSVGRMNAASIVLSDTILWVTGGIYGDNFGNILASTEKVTTTGTMHGPDLPIALSYHAMVALNSAVSMVIGGYSVSYHASTFYYDHIQGEWSIGPSLMQARATHAAGIVTDEETNENFVAVVGGIDDPDYLESTELLQDGKWVQGKINYTITIFWKFLAHNTATE